MENKRKKEYRFMKAFVTTFCKEENGQDMVEYSLLLGFIALAGIPS